MNAILVKTKNLIDGTGRPPVRDAWLLVKNGLIDRIGDAREFRAIEPGTEIVDAGQAWVLPGLIDSHTHLSIVPAEGDQLAQLRLPASQAVVRSIPNLHANLRSGVTAMRVMGQEHHIDLDIRDAIARGRLAGPRLLASGIGLVASNGHGVALTTTDGVEEVRRLARRNLGRGADFVKMFVTGGLSSANKSVDFCGYTPEEVAAAVEEAGRVGKYVAAHAHGGRGVDLCIQQGVRTIEHGAFISEAQLERIIERQLWIVGTFTILFHPEGIEKTDFRDASIRDKVLRARDVVEGTFRRIVSSGANLTLGTDSMHGMLAYELECLVRFGASPLQAISAVTGRAAQACRIEEGFGTLEAGRNADFILVDGDPLADIRAIARVREVYQSGRLAARGDSIMAERPAPLPVEDRLHTS